MSKDTSQQIQRQSDGDYQPEIRLAMADPEDLEDEDKEMLAEGRVRISNVKGKKAKKKARVRALEEARRLAQIQKFRELRKVGVSFIVDRKPKIKVNEYGYGDEIPMQIIQDGRINDDF